MSCKTRVLKNAQKWTRQNIKETSKIQIKQTNLTSFLLIHELLSYLKYYWKLIPHYNERYVLWHLGQKKKCNFCRKCFKCSCFSGGSTVAKGTINERQQSWRGRHDWVATLRRVIMLQNRLDRYLYWRITPSPSSSLTTPILESSCAIAINYYKPLTKTMLNGEQ